MILGLVSLLGDFICIVRSRDFTSVVSCGSDAPTEDGFMTRAPCFLFLSLFAPLGLRLALWL